MNAAANTSYAELNAVLDRAEHSHGPIAATDDQLLALLHRWTTALAAKLDSAIEFSGPEPLVDAVASAWRELAGAQATLRKVLDDGEACSPALADAMRTEFRMLALAGGICAPNDPADEAARLGHAFRDLIRSGRAELTPELARVG
ncbi:MAG: hypothetical protein J2P19_14865 [Pseudonocardia sp.]|nr:hypothetical protein [Pseudonocardia sp.]